jgi:hypothetical protein
MPCTKAQLVAAINSYAAARQTGDGPLVNLAAQALTAMVDTLEFTEPPAEAEADGGQE